MYASSQLDDGFLEVSVLFFYILHGVLGLVWGRRVFFIFFFVVCSKLIRVFGCLFQGLRVRSYEEGDLFVWTIYNFVIEDRWSR